MYKLVKTTPIDQLSRKDIKAIDFAHETAQKSDFKTFRLGAVIQYHSKVCI